MTFNDPPGCRQSQSRAGRSGRKEGPKNPVQVFRFHPLAGVNHIQTGAALRQVRRRPGLNGELASLGHGLLRVEKQVQERLFEQVAIQVHGRQVRGEVALDVDVVLSRAGREEIDNFLNDLPGFRASNRRVSRRICRGQGMTKTARLTSRAKRFHPVTGQVDGITSSPPITSAPSEFP